MAAVNKKIIEDFKKDAETKASKINELAKSIQRAEGYLIGIGIVTAFGFVTLLLTSWSFFSDSLNFKASTYQSLVDKVNEISKKIDDQNNFLFKSEVDSLQLQIADLKKKNPYLK